MREILFRGKRTDNGEWVYGNLVRGCDKKYSYIVEFGNEELCRNYVDVNPETIGQYTGLTDKNGKRIFEGDMINPFDDEIDKMVVEFRLGQFLLCLYGERGYMAEYGWEEEGNYVCFEADPLSIYGDDIEVVGNIHDSPELLRGDINA